MSLDSFNAFASCKAFTCFATKLDDYISLKQIEIHGEENNMFHLRFCIQRSKCATITKWMYYGRGKGQSQWDLFKIKILPVPFRIWKRKYLHISLKCLTLKEKDFLARGNHGTIQIMCRKHSIFLLLGNESFCINSPCNMLLMHIAEYIPIDQKHN